MKKFWLVLFILLYVSCIKQTVRTDATFLDNYTFDEVWNASIKAVDDIDFIIDGMDKDSGFIAAESGRHIFQKASPRLAIKIKEVGSRIFIDCKVLQNEQFVDLFGIGRKTIRKFMVALNQNLNG